MRSSIWLKVTASWSISSPPRVTGTRSVRLLAGYAAGRTGDVFDARQRPPRHEPADHRRQDEQHRHDGHKGSLEGVDDAREVVHGLAEVDDQARAEQRVDHPDFVAGGPGERTVANSGSLLLEHAA